MSEDGRASAADADDEEGEHEGDARAADREERQEPGADAAEPEGESNESEDPQVDESPAPGEERAVGVTGPDGAGATGSRTETGDDEGESAVDSGRAEDSAPGAPGETSRHERSGVGAGADTGAEATETARTEEGTSGRSPADAPGNAAEGSDVESTPGTMRTPETEEAPSSEEEVPEDVRRYDRFQKVDRASYDRVNEFLRDRTYITAREWAIARLCADFRTATGVEMTKIGENLPELVPFMTDTYSPQAVNQARSAFENKVRMAGATFLYGAMSGFFTADELDDLMYEVTEVAKFLLEVEGVELTVDEELDAEDRISAVMREVRQASEELRFDEVACPHCGGAFRPEAED